MVDNVDQPGSPLNAEKPRRRWRSMVVTILAVIILGAGGVAGYSWWRVHRTFQEVNSIPPLP
ncbi:MAG: hypothetical protein ACRDHN_13525, partial [Thermomicrobiales bacterium]